MIPESPTVARIRITSSIIQAAKGAFPFCILCTEDGGVIYFSIIYLISIILKKQHKPLILNIDALPFHMSKYSKNGNVRCETMPGFRIKVTQGRKENVRKKEMWCVASGKQSAI